MYFLLMVFLIQGEIYAQSAKETEIDERRYEKAMANFGVSSVERFFKSLIDLQSRSTLAFPQPSPSP